MFRWLLSWLRGAPAAVPVTASYAPPRILPKPAPAGRIALVIGHNSRAQGAVRITDGRTEYDWNGELAARIAAKDPARYVLIRRQPGQGEIARAYREADAAGVRASVELHFNAASPAATGTETLTSGSAGSRRLATLVQQAMVRALGLRDRGLLVRNRTERGGASLHAGRAPAILIEPFFGSNAGDCAAADRALPALATGIHQACLAFLEEN